MAQNTTISIPAATWTLLTNSDITAATLQNLTGNIVLLAGTVGATPPTDALGAIRLYPGQLNINTAIASLYPGVTGANRLYAYSSTPATVFISHA